MTRASNKISGPVDHNTDPPICEALWDQINHINISPAENGLS